MIFLFLFICLFPVHEFYKAFDFLTFYICIQGKYEETIKECTKALELNPTYMKALARRGEAHEKLEHYEEAIAGKFGFNIIVKRLYYC
jgi:tetratricopeptide (TPR) repeat protein